MRLSSKLNKTQANIICILQFNIKDGFQVITVQIGCAPNNPVLKVIMYLHCRKTLLKQNLKNIVRLFFINNILNLTC